MKLTAKERLPKVFGLFLFCHDADLWQLSNCLESVDEEVSEGSDSCCDTDSNSNGMCRSFVHKQHSLCEFVAEQWNPQILIQGKLTSPRSPLSVISSRTLNRE